MRYEVKTFHLPNGEGEIPAGWKPLGILGTEVSLSIWVVCTHAYTHQRDKLRGEDE